jgi:hypothetical protein
MLPVEYEARVLWQGRRGLFLFSLVVVVVFGLSWAAWIGFPVQLLSTEDMAISRGRYHKHEVAPWLWWLSCLTAIITLVSFWVLMISILLFASIGASQRDGRNFKTATFCVMVFGALGALIGAFCATFGN